MPEGIQVITIRDSQYPDLLREIFDPPKKLYVRGHVELLSHQNLLAVVGSRQASSYGQQVINKLLPPVVAAGVPIVSGLAFGIDSLAHRACVDQDRPTIAVLGSGIDDASIYPRSHCRLADEILQNNGLLVTEYEAGIKPRRHFFPARNRIIAGLGRATLIVQAARTSGSLITARLAMESNRDVCAVPGPITDPLSAGTNQLIKEGATPITEADDLLRLLGVEPAEQRTTDGSDLSLDHRQLLDKLSHQPQHVDVLVTTLHLPAQKITSLLLELELAGHVQNVGGLRYVRR